MEAWNGELWSNFHVDAIKNLCDSIHAHQNYQQFRFVWPKSRQRGNVPEITGNESEKKPDLIDLLRFGSHKSRLCEYFMQMFVWNLCHWRRHQCRKGICPNYHSQTVQKTIFDSLTSNTCYSIYMPCFPVALSSTYMQMDLPKAVGCLTRAMDRVLLRFRAAQCKNTTNAKTLEIPGFISITVWTAQPIYFVRFGSARIHGSIKMYFT